MSLSALIRKRQPCEFATATVATLATFQPKTQPSVATVASVAVANAETVKTGDGKPCSQWLFHFADRDDLPVTFAPAVNHAVALSHYPEAVAAEPIHDRPHRKPTKAEANELTALVMAIYANDTDDDRAEALAAALADPDGALLCYRAIAEDRGIAIAEMPDDRRTCTQCQCLQGRVCSIAYPGGLVFARRGYTPMRDMLHRCAGYQPNTIDTDQRASGERWPGLTEMKGTK